MIGRRAILLSLVPMAFLRGNGQQPPEDQLLQITRDWLQAISKGDRKALNSIMDARFIATTPGGDVLTKDRLVPNEEDRPVQKLAVGDLDNPMVRIYSETAVLMSRLKPRSGSGPSLNGTFVYHKHDSAWKLIAMHLSVQK